VENTNLTIKNKMKSNIDERFRVDNFHLT